MVILIFFIALWYSSLFCQTFFQHRYAAHGAFKMSKGMERLFFIITYIAQGSSYMSPRAYAIMHRMHHAYTDTDLDPHSPSYSKTAWSMMIRTRNIYSGIFKGKIEVEPRFLKNLPEWPAFDKWANGAVSRIMWGAIYLAIFITYARTPWVYLLFPIVLGMGAFHGVIINWFAHKYGYKNFILKNTSENLLSVDVLMLGESYHNNHHKYPSSINFGVKWYEFDPVYHVIRFLGWLKIIKINPSALVVAGKE